MDTHNYDLHIRTDTDIPYSTYTLYASLSTKNTPNYYVHHHTPKGGAIHWHTCIISRRYDIRQCPVVVVC